MAVAGKGVTAGQLAQLKTLSFAHSTQDEKLQAYSNQQCSFLNGCGLPLRDANQKE